MSFELRYRYRLWKSMIPDHFFWPSHEYRTCVEEYRTYQQCVEDPIIRKRIRLCLHSQRADLRIYQIRQERTNQVKSNHSKEANDSNQITCISKSHQIQKLVICQMIRITVIWDQLCIYTWEQPFSGYVP